MINFIRKVRENMKNLECEGSNLMKLAKKVREMRYCESKT